MRARLISGLGLLLLCLAMAGTAGAARAVAAEWPTAHDIQLEEPGVRAGDAECIAKYYRGRLSRTAWHTQYYGLTRAQKLVEDAGFNACMGKHERIATTARTFAAIAGPHSEWRCVARGFEAQSRADRLAETTAAREYHDWGTIFRACRITGVLYASVGSETQLALTPAEQACANRIGAVRPVLHRKGQVIPTAYLKAIGGVFDTCVGRKSEESMYRFIFRQFPNPALIACLARRSAANVTFADLLSGDPRAKSAVQDVTKACMAASTTG